MSHQNPRLGASRLAVGEGPREPEGLTLRPSEVSQEPVTYGEVRDFLRVTDAQSGLLATFIRAVRTEAERLSHRLLTRRSVEAEWDSFYKEVALPRPPVDSVSSVETYDTETGTWSAVDAADYLLRGRRLELEDGLPAQPLRVTYTAGYDTVPPDLKRQMLQDIRHAYDHRDPTMGDVVQSPDVYVQYRPY